MFSWPDSGQMWISLVINDFIYEKPIISKITSQMCSMNKRGKLFLISNNKCRECTCFDIRAVTQMKFGIRGLEMYF